MCVCDGCTHAHLLTGTARDAGMVRICVTAVTDAPPFPSRLGLDPLFQRSDERHDGKVTGITASASGKQHRRAAPLGAETLPSGCRGNWEQRASERGRGPNLASDPPRRLLCCACRERTALVLNAHTCETWGSEVMGGGNRGDKRPTGARIRNSRQV